MVKWSLFLVWKNDRGGGHLLLTSTFSIVLHCCCWASVIGCHVANGNMAPASRVNTKKEGEETAYLNSCGQWRRLASSLSGWCGTSIDVPHHLHPVRTVFLLLPSVHVVLSVWLVMWHCHIVVVIGVVERLWDVAMLVVVETKHGWWWSRRKRFVW